LFGFVPAFSVLPWRLGAEFPWSPDTEESPIGHWLLPGRRRNRRAKDDINVLIYALAQNDPRSKQAEELLASGGILSVQILNEFVSVARRKILMSWSEIQDALSVLRILCPSPLPITVETHEAAPKIAEKYGYRVCDALVVAAALESACAILHSEGLRDGQMIEGQLTSRNPFAQWSRYKPPIAILGI
jgi:predicted nucleic acid-binding protein